MKYSDDVPAFVAELELIINGQKKEFLETSLLLNDRVFCDSEDREVIGSLRYVTAQ